MSVESWARRASGLLVPRMGVTPWRFGPCANCCGSGICTCEGSTPTSLEVEISGVTECGVGPGCETCAGDWNTTHVVTLIEGFCWWEKTFTSCSTTAKVVVTFLADYHLNVVMNIVGPWWSDGLYRQAPPNNECSSWSNEPCAYQDAGGSGSGCYCWFGNATVSVSAI